MEKEYVSIQAMVEDVKEIIKKNKDEELEYEDPAEDQIIRIYKDEDEEDGYVIIAERLTSSYQFIESSSVSYDCSDEELYTMLEELGV